MVLLNIVETEYFLYLTIITVFSIASSFTVMIFKNQQPRPEGTGYVVLIRKLYSGFNPFNRPEGRGIKPLNTNKYLNKKIGKTKMHKVHLNPLIKSTFQDYFTSDFFQVTVMSFVLCIILVIELLKSGNQLHEVENSYLILIGFVAALSIGFMGIIDSIPRANWRFYSIISPSDYCYHLKRTFLFLISIFSPLIAAFIFSGLLFVIPIMIKYFYCLIVVLCVSISIGFTVNNIIIKVILSISVTALTIWLSTLSVYFLLLPAFLTFIITLKAKSEYKEWYYL
jgi:hypothetical protein